MKTKVIIKKVNQRNKVIHLQQDKGVSVSYETRRRNVCGRY